MYSLCSNVFKNSKVSFMLSGTTVYWNTTLRFLKSCCSSRMLSNVLRTLLYPSIPRIFLYVSLSNLVSIAKPFLTSISKLKLPPFAPNNKMNGFSSIKKKISKLPYPFL